MLQGRTEPRIWTRPLRKLTPETSAGFDVIAFAKDVLGINLLPWQEWFLIHALELLEDGSFRFRTIILLVGRQNGKSLILAILALWWMYVFGRPLTIGTAQNLDVAEEQWEVAVELAQGNEDLNDEIDRVYRVNGKKSLQLKTRQRYKVAAASRRGGRGLSGDLVLLDELREHQTWDAWAAVTKTTMARALALILAASNAGDAASVVLRHLRRLAHIALGDPDNLLEDDEAEPAPEGAEVDDDSLAIFEWSAKPGVPLNDRDAWAQANPALGYRRPPDMELTERAILGAMRTDPEPVFRMEVLCQWLDHTAEGPFPPGAWEACLDETSTLPEDAEIGACVDVSWDRSVATIAVAGWRDDGVPHVEVVASEEGTDWVADWFTHPEHPHRATWPVAVQAKRAPAADLVDDLEDAGVDVIRWDGVEGTGDFYDRIRAADPENDDPEPGLAHLAQPALDVAAANAATRPVGDTWAWDRRRSPVDISPLVASTGAFWAIENFDHTTIQGDLMVGPSEIGATT